MGSPGKWLKSLINLKKPSTSEQEKLGDKNKKKWKLWRSSSEGFGSSSAKGAMKRSQVAALQPPISLDDALAAAMATLVRTQPKDFKVVKKEWAAIRIQAVFRGFLARRALRALRAVVRIQAIFRGRQVRMQAAVTLRCMQALVRVQAHVRAQRASISPEEESVQNFLDENCYHCADPIKQAEEGWCDSPGTVGEVRSKLQMRQKANIKRERAIAYSYQQRPRSSASPYSRTSKASKCQKIDENNPEWSWLEKWMAAKPWENRLMEEMQSVPSELSTYDRKSGDDTTGFYPFSSEENSVKVRKNNVTTRIAARPHTSSSITRSSCGPSSDFLQNESSGSVSISSTSQSPTIASSNYLKVENLEDANFCKPSYMSLTESTKAKQRDSNFLNMQRHSMEEYHYHNKSMGLLNDDARSNFAVDPCPPMSVARVERRRHGRQ